MATRHCIVTGTSSGLGLAVARALLGRGWSVAGLSRRPAPLDHPAYLHHAVDLADLEALGALAERGLAPWLSAPDLARLGLVNDAAQLGPVAPLARAPPREVGRALLVDAAAPMVLLGLALRAAGAVPLRVVNVSSGAARTAYAGWGAYCAGKAALRLAGEVAALESAGRDVRVVSYEPGVLDTAMQAEVRRASRDDFPQLDRFLALHAEGRLVSPEAPAGEIAALLERDDLAPFTELRHGAPGGAPRR
jgi:NAD(P)-dependent dehydrogenase (short-subunit alcohol dehydrogenase family)